MNLRNDGKTGKFKMKYFLLLFFVGNPANGYHLEFDSMAACQDAKTVIMGDAGGLHVTRAYCFPSNR